LRLFELRNNKTGSYGVSPDEPQKVTWFVDHNFEEGDVEDFEYEILRMLNHYNLTAFEKQYAAANEATEVVVPDFSEDYTFEEWQAEFQKKNAE